MKTLVIAAHMDDEVLSCGALIYDRVARGGAVNVICVYGRRYQGERQELTDQREFHDMQRARLVLKYQNVWCLKLPEGEPAQVGYYAVLEQLEPLLNNFEPDEVVIPSAHDLNQDHRFLHHVCKIALRPANLKRVARVLEMRAFDAEWTEPSYFLEFDKRVLGVKLAAVACYRREARGGNHVRSPKNIAAWHQVCGAKVGAEYAEAYGVVLLREKHLCASPSPEARASSAPT